MANEIGQYNHVQIAQEMVNRARQSGKDLGDPIETAYGFGWIPTATIWKEERRIHFYFGFTGIEEEDLREDVYTLEIGFADFSKKVYRTPIRTLNEAWEVVDKFLFQDLSGEEISGYEWMSNRADSNKHIPHPPDRSNPASISWLLNQGKWEKWNPPAR